MPLFPCPDCRTQISRNAESCPKCGARITAETVAQSDKNLFLTMRVLLGILVLVGLYWGAKSAYLMVVDSRKIEVNGKVVTIGQCKADLRALNSREPKSVGDCGAKAGPLLETAINGERALSELKHTMSSVLDSDQIREATKGTQAKNDEAWKAYRTEVVRLEKLMD